MSVYIKTRLALFAPSRNMNKTILTPYIEKIFLSRSKRYVLVGLVVPIKLDVYVMFSQD